MLCSECQRNYPKLAIQLAAKPRDQEILIGSYQRGLNKKALAAAFGLNQTTINKAFALADQRVSGYCATKHGKR